MTTDATLNAWKRWLAYAISKQINSPLSTLTIQLRDSEETKTYPGIYIKEGSVNRIESGGIKDGNAWRIEVMTQLVTTPGEDDQAGTSKAAHDALRDAISPHANDCNSEDWLSSQIGIVCFQVLTSSPVTTEEDGYRVTTWSNDIAVCIT